MKTKLADILIDKELEIVGAKSLNNPELPATHKTIEEDTNKGLFGKEDWFTYYTFKTEKQYNEWKDFCIDYIKREKYYWTKILINQQFAMYDLMFGLKQEY